LFYTDKHNSHVVVFKIYLVVSRWLVFSLGYVFMPVPDDGFLKRLEHLAWFGQWKVLSENTAVIDGPPVCLLQKYESDLKQIFSRSCILCVSSANPNLDD